MLTRYQISLINEFAKVFEEDFSNGLKDKILIPALNLYRYGGISMELDEDPEMLVFRIFLNIGNEHVAEVVADGRLIDILGVPQFSTTFYIDEDSHNPYLS